MRTSQHCDNTVGHSNTFLLGSWRLRRLSSVPTALIASVILWVMLLHGILLSAQGTKRLALVVGNGNYQSVQHLTNPTNDADLIAAKLKSLGFTRIGGSAQKNLALDRFNGLLKQFATEAASVDVGIFYYAGHGVQVNGINYLVPTDSNPVHGVTDVPIQMIDASSVLDALDKTNIRLKIMILDSCRNNPFATRGLLANGLADMSSGLAGMSAPKGTVIWYATQPGKVAQDGTGNNGPFALAISHNVDIPGQDIYAVFNKTGLEVMNTTNPPQQPWLAATPLDGTFYFKATRTLDAEGTLAEAQSTFSEFATDPSASDRIRRLFSSGITTPTRSFTLGATSLLSG